MTNENDLKIDQIDDKLAPKYHKDMRLALLNGAVLTNIGSYCAFPVPLESARILANSMPVESFIGHQTTAKLLSKILHRPIEYRREELHQTVGQMALIFKLKERAPEGQVLTQAELEKIGYEFWVLYRSK